ncbi:hypothetical protein PHMEG_00018294 [Phytophthora megakarya]|uniref:Uncharacterized protein n=1 Tax=Phytophthora megakarya TaxID=4795 RepID=A0A225VU46_9STRA|nr:hypothetical protein PHMEG_00018294 [Phytophthora megakarya]
MAPWNSNLRIPTQQPPNNRPSEGITEEIPFSLAQTFYPSRTEQQLKRAFISEDSSSTSDEAAHDAKKRRSERRRKGERPVMSLQGRKKHLLKELAYLEARATVLCQEAEMPNPMEVAATEHQVAESRQLKKMIQMHQNAMLAAQSAFVEFSTLRSHNPLESYIHLNKDTAARRSEVFALKDSQLQRAKKFLKQRMELVTNPNQPFHEESGYMTEEGHYIATKLEVHQFVGVKSVKQVFDALEFYFLNLEITTTKLGEDLTVREDSNDLESSNTNPMMHHRLVTTLSNGSMIEKNAIKFFQYDEVGEDGEGPSGFMAEVPVDEDDLYPYSPTERLRKDTSAAMKILSFTRKKETCDDDETELVVVLTRWLRLKLHHSEIKLSSHVLQEVQRSVSQCTDHMVHSSMH